MDVTRQALREHVGQYVIRRKSLHSHEALTSMILLTLHWAEC